jgi:predicted  nucleic acid-binding Zn-ribbon protein
MSQVTEIVQLQAIDDEAAALRAALDDVERRLRGSEELDAARRELAAAETAVAEAQREQRRVEGHIEGLSAKIDPEEKRLYDGSVKNPKELGSIQQELEQLKQRRSEFEDELLEILSRLDTFERDRLRTAKTVSQLEQIWEREQQNLKHESKRLADAIRTADQKRDVQKANVNPRSLHTYEEVRRKRGGNAIARIQGGVCGGCRITLPDGLRRRIFAADTLVQCPNCERILYIG